MPLFFGFGNPYPVFRRPATSSFGQNNTVYEDIFSTEAGGFRVVFLAGLNQG